MLKIELLNDQNQSQSFDVKEEPIEEFYVPETVVESETERLQDAGSCCLCAEGETLQNMLLEHIEKIHPENGETQSADHSSSPLIRSFP
jgi:hypothetical protein